MLFCTYFIIEFSVFYRPMPMQVSAKAKAMNAGSVVLVHTIILIY